MSDQPKPGTGFLTDADLVEAVKQNWIKSCQHDATTSWQGADSQIQASSIDLHAKGFFTPADASGNSKSAVDLQAGGAVVYYTNEELNLPSDVMGFVFTPTQLSLKGFFCSSIGHIDPGFKGPLRLVGINLGCKSLALNTKTKVATIVLFKLNSSSVADHTGRNGVTTGDQAIAKTQAIAPHFASDFGNFHQQAKEVAEIEGKRVETSVDKALTEMSSKVDLNLKNTTADVGEKLSSTKKSIVIPLLLALIATPFIAMLTQIEARYVSGLDDLSERISKLEGITENAKGGGDLRDRVTKLEADLNSMARGMPPSVLPAKSTPAVKRAPRSNGHTH